MSGTMVCAQKTVEVMNQFIGTSYRMSLVGRGKKCPKSQLLYRCHDEDMDGLGQGY